MPRELKLSQLKKVFIIAEAGSNFHISDRPSRNFKHALTLIDRASQAGADAVKFQLFRADKLYTKDSGYAKYLGKKRPIYDIIKDNELPYEWLPDLKKHCEKRKIMFLCTPFDEISLSELEKIKIRLYKIASYTINHLDFLSRVAKTRKPIILSTGASSIADVQKAVQAIRKAGNANFALLQCTAKYPASLASMELKNISLLARKFRCSVGLSDHSRDPLIAPLGAVALGAKIIEKHFTSDNQLSGPDHAFAVTADELSIMVKGIRDLELALGNGTKRVLSVEKELYSFCRRKIFATRSISKGERLTPDNIAALRPGTSRKGIDASKISSLYGRTAKQSIQACSPITVTSIR